jgi:hypothetical protein
VKRLEIRDGQHEVCMHSVVKRWTTGLFFGWLLAVLPTLAMAAEAPAAAKPGKPASDETWQSIYMSGQRVGFVHAVTQEIEKDGRKIIVSDNLTGMTIKRFGFTLKMSMMQTSEEDADGNLLRYKFTIDNPPNSHTETRGEIVDGKLEVTTTNSGRETKSTLPWDADVKSPAWIERILEVEPLKEGEKKSFKMFSIEHSKVATVTLIDKGKEETKLLDGSMAKLERIDMTHSLVPLLVLQSYADDKGETVKTVTNLMGMETYTVSKDEALKEVSGGDLDVGAETVIKTEPIPKIHQAHKAVYKITIEGQAGDAFSEGPTQHVKKISDTELELTVISIKPGEKGDQPQPGNSFLDASQFLDSNDARVQALAKEGAAGITDPAKLAIQLEKFVHDRLTDKNFSTALATASEVARDLAGDCTEHAVLLAALLRANKIPARVAIGFVYAKSIGGFGGHMWTEAYINGQWVPLDATLAMGGIGCGHLKISDSDLAENSAAPVSAFIPIIHLLGKTKVEAVKVE